MNQAHIHLLITHLPIFGSILGCLVLIYGLWRWSSHTVVAAYILFIVSSIGAGIAYLTGEGAEEIVEHIAGVSKHLIGEHEESAVITLVSLIILGVASAIGILLSLRKSAFSMRLAVVVLCISLVSFGLATRTGYLGGQIRHTEINSNQAPAAQRADNNEQD